MGLHGCGDGVNGPKYSHQPAASNCREEINKLREFCVWIGGLPQGPITSWIQFRVWRSVRWIWKILVEMKHCSSSSIKSCFFILIQNDEWNLIKYLFGKKKKKKIVDPVIPQHLFPPRQLFSRLHLIGKCTQDVQHEFNSSLPVQGSGKRA